MREKLTKGDVAKIEAELEHRKVVVRKQAAQDIAEAAAQGDRSENFEYYAAKKFRGENESRIRYLERVLKTAVIISDESKDDEVGINNTVVIFDRDMQEEETLRGAADTCFPRYAFIALPPLCCSVQPLTA